MDAPPGYRSNRYLAVKTPPEFSGGILFAGLSVGIIEETFGKLEFVKLLLSEKAYNSFRSMGK